MKFEITKQQILELNNNSEKLKEWFPEAFETNGWYKDSEFPKWTMLADFKNKKCYGIDKNGNWYDSDLCLDSFMTPTTFEATEEEVFEALKNEAIKRGFVEGNYECLNAPRVTIKTKNDYFLRDGELWRGEKGCANCVFKNGKWATIIETITRQEAEKLLNKKIID